MFHPAEPLSGINFSDVCSMIIIIRTLHTMREVFIKDLFEVVHNKGRKNGAREI